MKLNDSRTDHSTFKRETTHLNDSVRTTGRRLFSFQTIHKFTRRATEKTAKKGNRKKCRKWAMNLIPFFFFPRPNEGEGKAGRPGMTRGRNQVLIYCRPGIKRGSCVNSLRPDALIYETSKRSASQGVPRKREKKMGKQHNA